MPGGVQQERNLSHVHARLINSEQDFLVVVLAGNANFTLQVDKEKLCRRIGFDEERSGSNFDYIPSSNTIELLILKPREQRRLANQLHQFVIQAHRVLRYS